ncbi:hypothetical protein ATI61_103261 [Archangium gephyra]|uniref:Uncharacterized protein n=1 Tax=Archangium gephyra TaxID=48 RepID=A0AAC8Q5S2_9BACT|nr:hypothetical protein [Archangium gephyra]AKJ01550.1 Hypothetical protein AA314_03176 [Archangium gephyra]REG34368.1 hypothetical protein ATI61_103261 [Archangium gephyra]
MKLHQKILLLSVVALASGCDVFMTTDAEGTRGRGAKAFDPYSSSASGAISLSLLQFKGCAILPNGLPVSPGSLSLPDYPAECINLTEGQPLPAPSEPTERLNVTPGALYFLREFTAVDTVFGRHTPPATPEAAKYYEDWHAPASWIRKQSLFKALDWTGMTVGRDEWRAYNNRGTFQRETYFENASWMLSDDDSFTLEVVDASGVVRTSITYTRRDFLAENSTTGRTRVSRTIVGLTRPEFPNDPVMHVDPDYGPEPTYQTTVKISLANSTNPFKSFRMPQLTGEGVIRVTWSLMKDKPFLFPVTFVPEQDRLATCFKLDADGLATSERVPCGFGLTQKVNIARPQNGKYFIPGETVAFRVSMQDGDGNGLHPREGLPTFNEYMGDQSNGFAYFNEFMLTTYRDVSSSESGFKVVGPLQDLKATYGTYQPPYFAYPQTSEPFYFLYPNAPYLPRGADVMPPTQWSINLPENAKPGTYAIYVKGHRNFMGERLNRLDPFFFQVGQEQPTTYPGRVGNCQICHNGVNSLSNLHHGLSVDHVEGCTVCHTDETVGFMPDSIHRIHMGSRKYEKSKSDCTLCHLTRESTLRPSLQACGSCHVQVHGTEYFDLKFEKLQNTPNSYGNCAQACHAVTPPAQHILPSH